MEGDSTYEASPLPPPNPHHPHCTFKGCDSANAPHVFNFAMELNLPNLVLVSVAI